MHQFRSQITKSWRCHANVLPFNSLQWLPPKIITSKGIPKTPAPFSFTFSQWHLKSSFQCYPDVSRRVLNWLFSIWRPIWRKNMFLNIICSSKLTVFLKLGYRKTVCFSEQIMSANKHPSIFSRQMDTIVSITRSQSLKRRIGSSWLLLVCIENKNRHHLLNFVKNQVYDRWLIEKQPRQDLGLCGF